MVAAAPAGAAADGPSVVAAADGEPAGNQELDASLGIAVGGRVSPGGLHIGGRYLYRLSDLDWFDGGLGFSFGSGEAMCFRDRDASFVCNHGALDGFGADVSVGIRRFLPGQQGYHPYVHGGVALRVVSYGGDDVTGVAVPVWLGAGVRTTVHDGIAVGGGAVLSVGPGWFSSDLGLEPQLSLLISAGVGFTID